MDGQLIINLDVQNASYAIQCLYNELFVVQKCMLIFLFSYISMVLVIANITHMDTAGQFTDQRKSIALIDPHVLLFNVMLADTY